MAALKAILTSEEVQALPEPLQEHYEAMEDGRHRLQVSAVGGISLEDVAGLKSTLSDTRGKLEKARKALAAFERDGDTLDAEKAWEALAKIEEMANWTPEDKVREQIEAQVRSVKEKGSKDLASKDERIKHLLGQLEGKTIRADAVAALTKHKGNVDLLLPHVLAAAKMVEEEGKFVSRVYDENGNVRLTQKADSTAPMDVEELVLQMKNSDTFATAFAPSGASGGGATGSDRPGGSRASYVLTKEQAKDPIQYRRAKEAAEKAGRPLEMTD